MEKSFSTIKAYRKPYFADIFAIKSPVLHSVVSYLTKKKNCLFQSFEEIGAEGACAEKSLLMFPLINTCGMT